MLKSPVYLVPYDFSKLARSTFKVASELAAANDGTVYLLHVVKTLGEKAEAYKLLEMTKNTLRTDMQKRVIVKVIHGNLYKTVGLTGDILEAQLTVMATHGATGIQRLLGSNALKMVAMSSTPYLLLVKEEELKSVDTIVMPFSFAHETLHVLDALVDFARQYESVIHLVGYYDNKEWSNEQSAENQQIAREMLGKHGLACEIANLPREKSYEEEISDYMYHVKADLIAASYFKNGILPPPNSFMQVMLDNDHSIPVLTVNGDTYLSHTSRKPTVFT